MAESKFKVGDRVAVYERGEREVGTVKHVHANGNLYIDLRDGDLPNISPKQCRRLVPRAKAREWWVALPLEQSYLSEVWGAKQPLRQVENGWVLERDLLGSFSDPVVYREVVHVREVLPKRSK